MKNAKTPISSPAPLASLESLDLNAVTGGCAACAGGGGVQGQAQASGAGAAGMAGGMGQIAGLIQQFAGGQK